MIGYFLMKIGELWMFTEIKNTHKIAIPLSFKMKTRKMKKNPNYYQIYEIKIKIAPKMKLLP